MEENHIDTAQEIEFLTPSSGNPLDTRTGHLDDFLNKKLERVFHKQTSQVMLHDIAKIASEHDPIDLAHASMRLPASARCVLFCNLPDLNAKIIFMINAPSSTRTSVFRTLDDAETVSILEGMPPDEAVWMLDAMSDRRMKRVLDRLDWKKSQRIRELQKHDRDSAGRLMTNEFFAFHMDTTIGAVSEQIRDKPGIDLTRWVFVLNDLDELIGFVPDRNLIINAADLPLRQVMRPLLHTVTPETSRDEVVDLVERYSIPALPVVSTENHLVGVISFDDAVEAIKDIADETIANIAGTAEDVSEYDPIIKRFMGRAPWLLVTLCAGLVTATGMSYFKSTPWFIFVPFFVPLIAGMSGNVGIQCSTLLVRSISSGELTRGNRKDAIIKELMMGALIGILFGLLCGTVVYFLNYLGIHRIGNDPYAVATIVCAGVFGACMTASLLGALTPFFFARYHIDPAVASGPIVTAFNDVLSTWVFFLAASSISYFFFF